jgi:hypothetical protein
MANIFGKNHFWRYAIAVGFLWLAYDAIFGGCDRYASKFSCRHIINNADHEAWYWRNLGIDNPDDERPIGRVVGLRACKDSAMRYAASIEETWNERAYICILVKQGEYLEKHRLLD